MESVWTACNGADCIGPLKATATRIVESQEQVATTALVDDAEEQYVLEQLLDASKPTPPPGAEKYHYLIWTPLRYPPLPWGSRFGRRMEAGIFYASVALETALAECAYYRFVFLSGLTVPLPNAKLTTEHTSFQVRVDTGHGLALDKEPFVTFAKDISDPARYETTQSLGAAMREAGVEAFTYSSARDLQGGTNLGVFALKAIKNRRPERMRQWICTTSVDTVSFIEVHTTDQPFSFSCETFHRIGVLPVPAC